MKKKGKPLSLRHAEIVNLVREGLPTRIIAEKCDLNHGSLAKYIGVNELRGARIPRAKHRKLEQKATKAPPVTVVRYREPVEDARRVVRNGISLPRLICLHGPFIGAL